MKTITRLIFIGVFALSAATIFAQNPPDPNGDGSAPGDGNTPVGGRAALSGGVVLLLALGAGYGGKKVYDLNKKKQTS